MFFKNLLSSGWLHALFIAVIAYPAGDTVQRLIASNPDNNILVFTFLFMLSASLALLLISGPGSLAIKTLKLPETWIYSFLQILVLILGLLVFKYISASEGSALFRIEVFLTLILSWIFLNQKLTKYELLGAGLILIGFYLLISAAEISVYAKALVVIFVIARSLSQSIQKIITELHKTNRKAQSFKDSLRVTGFIMAVASLVFLVFLLSIAWLKQYAEIELFQTFPHFSDFADKTVCLSATILGFFVLSFSKYCEFYAGKTIGAKYLTSILSFYIIIVMIVEKSLISLKLIDPVVLTPTYYIALAIVVLGSLVISVSGFLKDLSFIKKGEKQDTLADLDNSYLEEEADFMILKLNLSNLSSLYDNDMVKLSKDLTINRVDLENILKYDLEDLKILKKDANKINRFALANVSIKDKLTKAYNRYYLDYMASKLFKDYTNFKLYSIDLNKFKPINDLYGHEAGDITLCETVKRLNKIKDFKDKVFRIGGDEFILLQVNNLDKNHKSLIIKTISKPIKYKKEQLEISVAVGISESKDFKTLKQMLKNADDLMFKHKKESKR